MLDEPLPQSLAEARELGRCGTEGAAEHHFIGNAVNRQNANVVVLGWSHSRASHISSASVGAPSAEPGRVGETLETDVDALRSPLDEAVGVQDERLALVEVARRPRAVVAEHRPEWCRAASARKRAPPLGETTSGGG